MAEQTKSNKTNTSDNYTTWMIIGFIILCIPVGLTILFSKLFNFIIIKLLNYKKHNKILAEKEKEVETLKMVEQFLKKMTKKFYSQLKTFILYSLIYETKGTKWRTYL